MEHHANMLRDEVLLVLTSANVGDEILNGLLGKELGEQTRPVRLDLDLGSLGQGNDVVGCDLQAIIGQNEGLREEDVEGVKRM